MDKPRITAEELAQKLVNSRKLMKKVDTGDYEKGNINEEVIRSSPEELIQKNMPASSSKRPVGTVDVNKVNKSRLPDNIKRAMIENPIPQITLNDNIDMDFAKKLMEQDGIIPPSSKQPQSKQPDTVSI